MARFRLTAGDYQSLPTVVLAEGIRRQGHVLEAIHVVTPWQLRRLWRTALRRGWAWLWKRAKTRAGGPTSSSEVRALADEYEVSSGNLKKWAREYGVPVLSTKDLNAPQVIRALSDGRQHAVIYSGGGILRSAFLEAAGRVLNAHAGPLPEVRGMNAAEWAVLLDAPPEVTVHLIDRGIDTGPVLLRRRYERTGIASVEQLREHAVATGIRALLETTVGNRWKDDGESAGAPTSRQCFVMAPALRQVVARRLAR